MPTKAPVRRQACKWLQRMQDWLDIDFAIRQGVDFIAVSFVKSAEVINNLKSYLSSRADKVIEIIAKVESHDSVPNLEEIVAASDAVMVARGDLGKLSSHPLPSDMITPKKNQLMSKMRVCHWTSMMFG